MFLSVFDKFLTDREQRCQKTQKSRGAVDFGQRLSLCCSKWGLLMHLGRSQHSETELLICGAVSL